MTTNNIETIIFSAAQLQKYLGMGRRQTYELIREGRFPVKLVKGKYLIPKARVDAWLYDGKLYNSFSRYA